MLTDWTTLPSCIRHSTYCPAGSDAVPTVTLLLPSAMPYSMGLTALITGTMRTLIPASERLMSLIGDGIVVHVALTVVELLPSEGVTVIV